MNNEQLLKRIEELENWKKNMEASHSIPLNVDQALRGRFFSKLITTQSVSDIAPTDRDQSTSAGGGDLVPQVFTGLIKAEWEGITVYIPYYQ